MPAFLDTRNRRTVALRICARCSRKFPYDELNADPNYPGLFVCDDDMDQFDPWRLPARAVENITLEYPRPDVRLTPGPMQIYANQLQAQVAANFGPQARALGTGPPEYKRGFDIGISGIGDQFVGYVLSNRDVMTNTIAAADPVQTAQQPKPWTANTFYPLGSVVTPTNPVGLLAAGEEIYVFVCIMPGTSAPNQPFRDFTVQVSNVAGPDPIPPIPTDQTGAPWLYEPFTGIGIGANAIGESAIEGLSANQSPPPVPFKWTSSPGTTVTDGGVIWLNAGLYLP